VTIPREKEIASQLGGKLILTNKGVAFTCVSVSEGMFRNFSSDEKRTLSLSMILTTVLEALTF